MASKVTRTANGYYARCIEQTQDLLEKLHTPEILALCKSVRKTQEGAVSLPLWIPVLMLLLLFTCISLVEYRVGIHVVGIYRTAWVLEIFLGSACE